MVHSTYTCCLADSSSWTTTTRRQTQSIAAIRSCSSNTRLVTTTVTPVREYEWIRALSTTTRIAVWIALWHECLSISSLSTVICDESASTNHGTHIGIAIYQSTDNQAWTKDTFPRWARTTFIASCISTKINVRIEFPPVVAFTTDEGMYIRASFAFSTPVFSSCRWIFLRYCYHRLNISYRHSLSTTSVNVFFPPILIFCLPSVHHREDLHFSPRSFPWVPHPCRRSLLRCLRLLLP